MIKTNRCARRWARIPWDTVGTWTRSTGTRSVYTLYTSSSTSSAAISTTATII